MTLALSSRRRSLFSPSAAAFIFLGSLAALWPVLIGNGVFLFVDSAVYLDQGERIWKTIWQMVKPERPLSSVSDAVSGAATGPQALLRRASSDADSLRSVPYAAFIGAIAPLGLVAAVYVQTCLVCTLIYAVVVPALSAAGPGRFAAAAAIVLAGSSLPFFAAFLMPDILGAVVILYGLLLVRGLDRFDTPSQVVLTLIAAFGVSSHYGNIPLAAAVTGMALVLRAWDRDLSPRLLGCAVAFLALPLAANTAVGLVAFDGASVAPKRFPFLLARSIQDGPARWYLDEACPEADYAVCDLWGDDIPDNVREALWSERGMNNVPLETYDRIRQEEPTILWHAVRRYPRQQMASFARNGFSQLHTVGTGGLVSADIEMGQDGRRRIVLDRSDPVQPYLGHLGTVHRAAYLGFGAVLVAMAVMGPGPCQQRRGIAVLAMGLLTNAFVFGGLSAPVDRYQARVAWLVPLLALAFLIERMGAGRKPTKSASAGRSQS